MVVHADSIDNQRMFFVVRFIPCLVLVITVTTIGLVRSVANYVGHIRFPGAIAFWTSLAYKPVTP